MLQAIAKRNKDEFCYRIELDPNHPLLEYTFICEEAADGHTFLSGSGTSLTDAVDDAMTGLKDACKDWGYKMPKG